MAKMQVNIEMDHVTKEEDHPNLRFVQPNRKGWWIVCIFPSSSGLKPTVTCFYFFITEFTGKKSLPSEVRLPIKKVKIIN